MTQDTRAPLKQVDFLVLAVLQGEPLHGYGIVQALEALTDGRVRLRPGDVYRVLYRMENEGLLRSTPAPEPTDDRRSYYRITAEGREMVRDQARLLSGVSAAVLARSGTDGA